MKKLGCRKECSKCKQTRLRRKINNDAYRSNKKTRNTRSQETKFEERQMKLKVF